MPPLQAFGRFVRNSDDVFFSLFFVSNSEKYNLLCSLGALSFEIVFSGEPSGISRPMTSAALQWLGQKYYERVENAVKYVKEKVPTLLNHKRHSFFLQCCYNKIPVMQHDLGANFQRNHFRKPRETVSASGFRTHFDKTYFHSHHPPMGVTLVPMGVVLSIWDPSRSLQHPKLRSMMHETDFKVSGGVPLKFLTEPKIAIFSKIC